MVYASLRSEAEVGNEKRGVWCVSGSSGHEAVWQDSYEFKAGRGYISISFPLKKKLVEI